MRLLVLLAAAPAWAAAPPIVGVTEAGSCPTASAVADAIGQVLDVSGRPAAAEGAEGELLLSVGGAEPGPGLIHVELRAPDGAELIARDLSVEGASCATRARSIAVVVQRYLEAMAVPPAGLHRAAEPEPLPLPPPRRPRSVAAERTHVEVRAGYSRDAQLDASTDHGLALDAVVQPWRRLVVRAGGRFHATRSEPAGPDQGEVHASRQEAHVAVGAFFDLGRVRAEGGVGGRLDVTTVSTTGLAVDGSSTRESPAALVFAGASLALSRRLALFTSIEFYGHFRTSTFQVEGLGEVERVSRAGLAGSLGLAWRIQ